MSDNIKNTDSKEFPISTHVFMFPFKWESADKQKKKTGKSFRERINFKKINEILLNSGKWEHKEFNIINELSQASKIEGEASKYSYENYNIYAYYYPYVRKAIFGIEEDKNIDSIVKNYSYIDSQGKYVINVRQKDSEKQDKCDQYTLNIQSIELKVYQTGIGVLIYKLENYNYHDTNTILMINDFGRRIYPQHLPLHKAQENFLSCGLEISFDNKEESIIEDWRSFDEKQDSIKNLNQLSETNGIYIAKTIMDLLGNKFKAKPDDYKDAEFIITPIIDDRMFVVSWYMNNELSEKIKENYTTTEEWSKFLFVDNGDVSCRNKEMHERLLKEHSYIRWLDYGSIYGTTRYSFVCITKDDNFSKNFIRSHMETIYCEMVTLTLAVRASIIRFSHEAALITGFKEKYDTGLFVKRVSDLYDNYLKFVNRLYFREVTAQEQGIELYKNLIKSMEIERDIKDLNEEIEKLHNHASLEEEKKTSQVINILTVLGGALLIPTLITGFFGMNIFEKKEMLNWWNFMNYIHVTKWIFMYMLMPITLSIIVIRILVLKNKTNSVMKYITDKTIIFSFFLMLLAILFIA